MNCDRAFMKIEFNSFALEQRSLHLFIAKAEDDSVFRLGRS